MWIALPVVAVIAAVLLIVSYYPPLGGKSSGQSKRRIDESPNRLKRAFVNQIPTDMSMSMGSMVKALIEFAKGNPRGKPAAPIPVSDITPDQLGSADDQASVTWFGHSAVLLGLDGKTLFLDPMLGRTPSPFPMLGGRRYSQRLPLEIDMLPSIDAVVLSHDHYDHLDYGTIKQLKHKVRRFIVPLGVAAHLERWGVDPSVITEHDWWDELVFEGIKLTCAPARHFSGRNIGDRNSTLWCSWVISGKQVNIYFSGDSGYGPHFKEIGDKFGPFDLTLMECGQYDERWAAIHMLPEQTVQAHIDVRGKTMIPIHWGAFTLALHDWTDPVERAAKAAEQRHAVMATPRIGETVRIGGPQLPTFAWWRS